MNETVQYKPDEHLFWSDGCTFMSSRLSKRATERYQYALWYAWGRDDAGDHRIRSMPTIGMGTDFAFAQFCATEAEDYEQQRSCSLRPIHDQYKRFVAVMTLLLVISS